MEKCPFCKKEVDELSELDLYLNEEHIGTLKACPSCAVLFKETAEKSDFVKKLTEFSKELIKNWEKGTKENTKVGSLVKIVNLVEEPEGTYVGSTGIVENIDAIGQLHGTWGGLAIIPEKDTFLVSKIIK